MQSIDNVKKLKKGRPPVESEAITLRLATALLEQLDDYRRAQPDLPNRQEAIRRILSERLDAAGKK